MAFKSFDERLDNWGRTVRTSPHRDLACAWWAELYVKIRDSRAGAIRPSIPRNELDGWMVEEAWKHLPNHVSKWILRYHFVFNMGQEQIQATLWRKHKVRLRGFQLEISLSNAKTAVCREIVRLTGDETVLTDLIDAQKRCQREELFI